MMLAYSDMIEPPSTRRATPNTIVATASIMSGLIPASPTIASTMVATPPIASTKPPYEATDPLDVDSDTVIAITNSFQRRFGPAGGASQDGVSHRSSAKPEYRQR